MKRTRQDTQNEADNEQDTSPTIKNENQLDSQVQHFQQQPPMKKQRFANLQQDASLVATITCIGRGFMHYGGKIQVLDVLNTRRDPQNEMDPCAIELVSPQTQKRCAFVAKAHAAKLAPIMDTYKVELRATVTFIQVKDAYLSVAIHFTDTNQTNEQHRKEIRAKLQACGYNMMEKHEATARYVAMQKEVSIQAPAISAKQQPVFIKRDRTYGEYVRGTKMKNFFGGGWKLFQSTVRLYDAETKQLVLCYERNTPELNEEFQPSWTFGNFFAHHMFGIDAYGEREKLKRQFEFQEERSPVYMQGFRLELFTQKVGMYKWDNEFPFHYKQSIHLYKQMTKAYRRVLPEQAKELLFTYSFGYK